MQVRYQAALRPVELAGRIITMSPECSVTKFVNMTDYSGLRPPAFIQTTVSAVAEHPQVQPEPGAQSADFG